MKLGLVVFIAVFPCISAQAQVRVEGMVVDKEGNPIGGAVIRMGTKPYHGSLADGSFRIDDVTPGGYTFSVQRAGFAPVRQVSYIEVNDQPVTGIRLVLARQGVITGTVSSPEGDPVTDVQVQILDRDYEQGERLLAPLMVVTTDDRGVYRAAGLAAGSYYVRAAGTSMIARAGRLSSLTVGPPQDRLVDTFYPSALEERDARRIDVAEGSEQTVDIRMRNEVRFTIRGRLVDPSGQPLAGARMTVQPDRELTIMDLQNSLLDSRATRADGGFEFHNLAPGRYWVHTPASAIKRELWGRVLVTVGNDDLNDLVVQAVPGATVTVSIEMDGGGPAMNGLSVRLVEEPLGMGSGQPQETRYGAPLVFESMYPGSYRVQMRNLPAGMYIKSIRMGDSDVTRQLIDIRRPETLRVVLSERAGEISGVLRPGVRVVLWPREPHPEWVARGVWSEAVDQNGEFHFRGVDPGNYLLAAWETTPDHSDTLYEFVDLFRDTAVPVLVAEDDRIEVEAPLVPAARILEEFAKLP